MAVLILGFSSQDSPYFPISANYPNQPTLMKRRSIIIKLILQRIPYYIMLVIDGNNIGLKILANILGKNLHYDSAILTY